MLKFTINGKTVRPEELEKEMLRVAAANVVQQVRDRLGSIRHPETGEFAMVIAHGDSLEDMSFRIEGTPALLEIVKARLSPEEQLSMTFIPTGNPSRVPRVFLSYGWEDRELAGKIAERLQANGIETWWAEWEIGAGDSIRRKIDAGLEQCTHFLVLLTPNSITRPWVNEEIDAGYMRKVGEKSRFIPLRHGIEPSMLPPLMSGMLSPEIDSDGSDIQQLINDIHGVSQKPALGPAPEATTRPKTGYTAAASTVAQIFVDLSEFGLLSDTQLTIEELVDRSGLPPDDVNDALHELRHFLKETLGAVLAKDNFYSEFDRYWKPWDPASDALKLAADLVNDSEMPSDPSQIAERYGWSPRRLNPAITYLQERDAVDTSDAIGSWPFATIRVTRTDATRRFVKSRS